MQVRQWEGEAAVARLLSTKAVGRRGRLALVLRGCFEGAKRTEIVEALKRGDIRLVRSEWLLLQPSDLFHPTS